MKDKNNKKTKIENITVFNKMRLLFIFIAILSGVLLGILSYNNYRMIELIDRIVYIEQILKIEVKNEK